MNRRTARTIHAATNLAYWVENPNWDAGDPVSNAACRVVRKLPFSLHEAQKRAFFKTNGLIAVNGESVVAANGSDLVDKYMLRYPGKMSLEAFRASVTEEVGAVTRYLAGVALPTQVSVKPGRVLKTPKPPMTVVQTQRRLDLGWHRPFDLAETGMSHPQVRANTARDLETLLLGADRMVEETGYYPDVAPNSGNLVQSCVLGTLSLMDVMPVYENGSRLIGDNPPGLLEHTQTSLRDFQKFVGQYGG